ncbi:hypothetical protein ALC57_13339 [Trachymyrmex cornetzi]|uniref:DNA-directed DNA polymerase n=1 Tax=Trachymyrmex cornetzi TaxID=471704 RepID=A0A151IZE3_9HYME|nr:hypothetical protein ALC57_13339 [Trachymyrmex cornetzi]
MENHERVERELLEQCNQVATLVECFAWLQRCDEYIERLEELCRAKLTGAVINFNYIEPRRFLEDAREIVLERVRDAVERHGSVKVNTAFNGEFATKDKRAIKSINTKNNEIYQYIDMREWCLHYFGSRERLQSHTIDCGKINDCAIHLPSEDDRWLEFGNHHNKERIPFVVYSIVRATGRYRGPAHSNCNLSYKTSLYIPVVFHNLSGYDAHFIIKEIATAYDGQVDVLPITKEKYISFTKHVDSTKDKNTNHFQKNCVKLRFIDSFKFLSTSLDKLASYLDKDKLKITRSEFFLILA